MSIYDYCVFVIDMETELLVVTALGFLACLAAGGVGAVFLVGGTDTLP